MPLCRQAEATACAAPELVGVADQVPQHGAVAGLTPLLDLTGAVPEGFCHLVPVSVTNLSHLSIENAHLDCNTTGAEVLDERSKADAQDGVM